MRRFRMRDVALLIASLALIAALSAALRVLPDVSATTVSLAFLLIVLASATIGRLAVAIVVSIVAMLTLNFFSTPRRHLHDCRSTELGGVVRLPCCRGDCQ